jgi:hypothetical protein
MRATLILVVMTVCCVSLAYRATALCPAKATPPTPTCGCAASCPTNCKVTPVTPVTKSLTSPAEGDYVTTLNEIVTCLKTTNINFSHDVSHAAKSLLNCNGKPSSILSEFGVKLGKTVKAHSKTVVTQATINGCITKNSGELFRKVATYTPELCTCKAA